MVSTTTRCFRTPPYRLTLAQTSPHGQVHNQDTDCRSPAVEVPRSKSRRARNLHPVDAHCWCPKHSAQVQPIPEKVKLPGSPSDEHSLASTFCHHRWKIWGTSIVAARSCLPVFL